jgi:predicted GH43/DUF377 family glycosyl hydrolase
VIVVNERLGQWESVKSVGIIAAAGLASSPLASAGTAEIRGVEFPPGAWAEQKPVPWPADRPFPKVTISERTTEPLFKGEMAWESLFLGWVRVLKIGATWHMWYTCLDKTARNDFDSILCHAVSPDGVHWTRPNLGLTLYSGSRRNNILLLNNTGASVCIDPKAPPERRLKLLTTRRVHERTWEQWVWGAGSADGLHWVWNDQPLMKANSDTDNVLIPDGDVYRLCCRMWTGGKILKGRRVIGCSESPTFGNFPAPVQILGPDAQDPPDLHFYNSGATKICDGLYVMFPGGFYTESQLIRSHLAFSRDGKKWERIGREPVLEVGKGFDSRSIYVAPGAIPAGAPGEYWFYYRGYDFPHDGKGERITSSGGFGRFRVTLTPAP